MKHIKKILSAALLCALVFSGCTVRAEATFKGKTESEWENSFKTTATTTLEKTGTPPDALNGFIVRVEGEDRISDTISGSVDESEAYSGGKALKSNFKRDDSVTKRVDLSVTVPETGTYSLTALVSTWKKLNCAYFDIYVNGSYVYAAADNVLSEQSVSGKASMRNLELTPISLRKGENTVSFVLQNSNRLVFVLDYIELQPNQTPTASGTIGYTSTPTGDYSKQGIAAAEIDVFTGSWDMTASLTVSSFASTEAEDADVSVQIVDYYGNIVFEDSVKPVFGSYKYTADLGKHPTGHFTLRATANGKTIWSKEYAVLPPVEDRDLELDSPFASDFASYHLLADEFDLVDNYAAAAKLCGVSVLRERLDWTEWKKGNYDFHRTDKHFNAISDMGMKIMPFISSAPNWITDTGKKMYMASQLEMYQFTKRAAQRYTDISQAFEIWNEMNYFVDAPADVYASFFKAASFGVIDGGNSLPKIVGGLCEGEGWTYAEAYTDLLCRNELFDYSDAFNWHYHIYDNKYDRPFSEFINGTIGGKFAAFANARLADLPSWCTEAGIKLFPASKTEDLSEKQQKIQSNYMVTSACQSLASGTDKHFWFILLKMEETDGSGWGWFGSFGSKNQPFSSVVTEAVMTQTLGKGMYKGALTGLPSGAEGHVINNGEDDVIVLWATSDRDVTLSVPGNVLKTTVVGDREVLCPTNGKITVKAGVEPIFITVDGTVDSSVYTATSNAPVKTVTAKTDYSAGERVVLTQLWYDLFDTSAYKTARNNGYIVSAEGNTITLKLVNFNDFEVSGTVSGSADGYTVTGSGETITIPAMSETEVTFTITPNGGTGSTYLTFEGVFNGSETSKSVSRIYR